MRETVSSSWQETLDAARRSCFKEESLRPAGERMVLVVEDDEDIAEMLCYSLARQGVRVAVAYDGLTGYALAEHLRPDLVLLDVMLPKMNGLELCRLLREHQDSGLARLPVVMLSALSMPADIEKGMAVGASAYFTKPYTVKDVVAAAMEWLGCASR